MKQAGIEPTSRSYTAVLCTHAKRGDIMAIRNTLDECKEKDILLANKEILDVIYTLALNKQSEHIDEVLNADFKMMLFYFYIIILPSFDVKFYSFR